jgi:hypothetical protein
LYTQHQYYDYYYYLCIQPAEARSGTVGTGAYLTREEP